MSGTWTVTVGDRGRLVVPVEVRERLHLREGSTLILLETDDGLVLLTREQLKSRVQGQLTGAGLVDALLAERRAEAVEEDAAHAVVPVAQAVDAGRVARA